MKKGEKGKRLGEREKNGADRNLTPAMLFRRHYSGSAVLTPTAPLNFAAACLRGEKKGFGGVVLPNGLRRTKILALKSVSKGKKNAFYAGYYLKCVDKTAAGVFIFCGFVILAATFDFEKRKVQKLWLTIMTI